jgi:hypothetical protein
MPSDDRAPASCESPSKGAPATNAFPAIAPLGGVPIGMSCPQAGWDDPQILDWDLMSPSNISHIHQL